MAKITYTNKVALNENPEIALINKVTDDDLNEIKSVVNTNDDNVGDLTALTTTTKTSAVAAINELNTSKASTNEVLIQNTEPTAADNKIWIDTGEIASPASEITNSYSTSTGIGYSANYVNNMNTYSNTEVRIGTYKDKPLYRKMLEFTTPGTANTNTEVATFDTTFTVRNFYGNIDVSSTGQVLPLNFYFSNEYLVATYPENGTGKVKMKVGTSAYTSLNVDMFIEYTKTTD